MKKFRATRSRAVATTKIEVYHPPKRMWHGDDGKIYIHGPTAHVVSLLHRVGWSHDQGHSVALFLNDQPVTLKSMTGPGDTGTTITFEPLSVPEILTSCFDMDGLFVANPEPTVSCGEGHHSECPGQVQRDAFGKCALHPCPCECHGVVEQLASLGKKS